MYYLKMLIDGQLVDAIAGDVATIHNPANQEPIAEVPVGGREDARLALNAAQRAFPKWAETTSQRRGEILHEGARQVRQRIGEIALLLTLEEGKPLKQAKREVLSSANALDYYAEEGKRNFGEWVPTESRQSRSLVIKQPIGVAAIITPWNYPVDLLAWKMGPALAAGCTVVAKPSSKAPLAATAFAQAVNDAGTPAGVVNVVHGTGREVGAELVENPTSRKIAFTGETDTGRWIMEHAAQHIKRISLELGGQSPFIVCKDASIDDAVESCVQRAFSNMGQICISVNRIYVADEIADEFISKFVNRTVELKIGDGLDPDVDLGPMFNEAQRQKTREHIADALGKGAKVLCGGHEPEGEKYKRGFFFLPTVLSPANHTMKVMREETFGPVAPIMRFKTLNDALRLANDTRYGLAAYIFTNDLTTAIYAAEQLEAGGIGVNVNSVIETQAPFGAWKLSGFGHERAHYGLEEYLAIKHIRFGLVR